MLLHPAAINVKSDPWKEISPLRRSSFAVRVFARVIVLLLSGSFSFLVVSLFSWVFLHCLVLAFGVSGGILMLTLAVSLVFKNEVKTIFDEQGSSKPMLWLSKNGL